MAVPQRGNVRNGVEALDQTLMLNAPAALAKASAQPHALPSMASWAPGPSYTLVQQIPPVTTTGTFYDVTRRSQNLGGCVPLDFHTRSTYDNLYVNAGSIHRNHAETMEYFDEPAADSR